VSGFRDGLVDAWARVAVFLPKFLGFLLILIIGYFIAKALGTLFEKVLEKVGFDRAVERGGVKDALARTSYDASDIVGKLVFYLLFLLVLQLAFGVFGPNPISDLLEGIIAYLPNVIAAIIIVVVAAAVAAAVRELAAAALANLSWGRVLANVAGGAILTVGFFAAVSQLQIAPAIVNAVFYAILAIIVGSLVIAIGGGGIQPMRERWQRALEKLDAELPRAREAIAGADQRVKERVEMERERMEPPRNPTV